MSAHHPLAAESWHENPPPCTPLEPAQKRRYFPPARILQQGKYEYSSAKVACLHICARRGCVTPHTVIISSRFQTDAMRGLQSLSSAHSSPLSFNFLVSPLNKIERESGQCLTSTSTLGWPRTTSSALARVMATLNLRGLRQNPRCRSLSRPEMMGGRVSGLESTVEMKTMRASCPCMSSTVPTLMPPQPTASE